ncbi:hypothetical protein PMAYCL1PPCAC_20838, partial [Pristionchus mayeri]
SQVVPSSDAPYRVATPFKQRKATTQDVVPSSDAPYRVATPYKTRNATTQDPAKPPSSAAIAAAAKAKRAAGGGGAVKREKSTERRRASSSGGGVPDFDLTPSSTVIECSECGSMVKAGAMRRHLKRCGDAADAASEFTGAASVAISSSMRPPARSLTARRSGLLIPKEEVMESKENEGEKKKEGGEAGKTVVKKPALALGYSAVVVKQEVRDEEELKEEEGQRKGGEKKKEKEGGEQAAVEKSARALAGGKTIEGVQEGEKEGGLQRGGEAVKEKGEQQQKRGEVEKTIEQKSARPPITPLSRSAPPMVTVKEEPREEKPVVKKSVFAMGIHLNEFGLEEEAVDEEENHDYVNVMPVPDDESMLDFHGDEAPPPAATTTDEEGGAETEGEEGEMEGEGWMHEEQDTLARVWAIENDEEEGGETEEQEGEMKESSTAEDQV